MRDTVLAQWEEYENRRISEDESEVVSEEEPEEDTFVQRPVLFTSDNTVP